MAIRVYLLTPAGAQLTLPFPGYQPRQNIHLGKGGYISEEDSAEAGAVRMSAACASTPVLQPSLICV